MTQHGKSFLKFDCWSTKAFANHEDLSQVMMSLFFHAYTRTITSSFMRWFLSVRVFGQLSSSLLFFFYLNFLIISSHIVFISILGLLSRSLQPTSYADSLRRLILQCSALSLGHNGFPVPLIYGPPYPTFQSHLVLRPSDVLLALLLVGDLSRICIFYHTWKRWSKHNSWSCWILWMAWPGRDISGELKHLWILSWCHMDCISSGSFRIVFWLRADILWWVYGYWPISFYPGFLETMLCALGSCYNGGYVSK